VVEGLAIRKYDQLTQSLPKLLPHRESSASTVVETMTGG
jgi:hypothetical protein